MKKILVLTKLFQVQSLIQAVSYELWYTM